VITGIGFLGAGVIMQTGRQVHGITTAATIWSMTAAGLAIGAGFYIPCVMLVALTWLSLAIDPLTVRFVNWRRKRNGLPEMPDERP
jgi:putative Mg2+ transporter-C (MgtC) family protein